MSGSHTAPRPSATRRRPSARLGTRSVAPSRRSPAAPIRSRATTRHTAAGAAAVRRHAAPQSEAVVEVQLPVVTRLAVAERISVTERPAAPADATTAVAEARRPVAALVSRVMTAAVWLVLAVVAALAVAIVVLPRIMGWVPLTILTGSMEPTIPTGSQVVVETVSGVADAAQLGIGDVITFMPHADDPTLVTHRIVGRTLAADGGVSFVTQGDATNAPDPWAVTAIQVRGHVRYHVPYAGYVANALSGDQKTTASAVAAVALLGYAGIQLAGAVRTRRQAASSAAVSVPARSDAEGTGEEAGS